MSPPHMVLGPIEFVTVDNMPAVKQTVSYSCGAKSVRTYQAGELVDVEWLRPIRRVQPTDVIQHREVMLYNHHYLRR